MEKKRLLLVLILGVVVLFGCKFTGGSKNVTIVKDETKTELEIKDFGYINSTYVTRFSDNGNYFYIVTNHGYVAITAVKITDNKEK